MANNSVSETYHEIPASKYYYLGDSIGAVPKWLFKFWTPFTYFAGLTTAIIALETNWFQIFLTYVYITQWMYGWGITATVIATLYVYFYFHRKNNQKLKVELQRKLAYENAVIQQNKKQRG